MYPMYPKCTFLSVISWNKSVNWDLPPSSHVKVIIATIHTQFTQAFQSASLSI